MMEIKDIVDLAFSAVLFVLGVSILTLAPGVERGAKLALSITFGIALLMLAAANLLGVLVR